MSESLAASFRDPAGSLFPLDGHIYRIINPSGWLDLSAFLESKSGPRLMERGVVVRTEPLAESGSSALLSNARVQQLFERVRGQRVVEHERVWFPSFPYEWPPEMLHAAGVLTIDLARELLQDNLGLKDATPYNVLFRGPNPVFIDVLSFERRDPGDPIWLPKAQFERTFLLPLLANKYFGVPLDQILATRRDGLEPEEVNRWLSTAQRLRPPFLSLVAMPTWLGARHNPDNASIYQKKAAMDSEKARFILETLLRGQRKRLDSLMPAVGQRSTWSDYMGANNNYTAQHFAAKQKFVEQAVAEFRPKRVLDCGCNTGHFSAIAARGGASVVAIDYDPVVLGDVWRNARAEKLDILPLTVNLTRPTPPMGWRNQEWPGFLDRARGAFDGLLMLAVIHHMLVTERVPLVEILELAAEITTGMAVIEFIAPEDSMFRRLTRGRDELHKDLTVQLFESACARHFEIARVQHLENTSRWLYLLRKR